MKMTVAGLEIVYSLKRGRRLEYRGRHVHLFTRSGRHLKQVHLFTVGKLIADGILKTETPKEGPIRLVPDHAFHLTDVMEAKTMAKLTPAGEEVVNHLRLKLRVEYRNGAVRLIDGNGFSVKPIRPQVINRLVNTGVVRRVEREGKPLSWVLHEDFKH